MMTPDDWKRAEADPRSVVAVTMDGLFPVLRIVRFSDVFDVKAPYRGQNKPPYSLTFDRNGKWICDPRRIIRPATPAERAALWPDEAETVAQAERDEIARLQEALQTMLAAFASYADTPAKAEAVAIADAALGDAP